MATSDGDSGKVLQSGSDCHFDRYCEPCDTEDQHLEASGFCQTCGVFMCTGCVRDHKRNPASRAHKLVDADAMPQTPVRPKVKDFLTQPCQKHKEKILEYYCDEDDTLCCHVCLNIDHILCKKGYIPEISRGTATSQEYKDVETSLDLLNSLATDEEKTIQQNEKDNKAYRSSAISDIKSSRQEMDKILDEAEDGAIKRVDKLYEQNTEKIRSASQNCRTVRTNTKTMSADLAEKAKAGKNNQLFVGVKIAAQCLPDMEKNIKQLKAQTISRYVFDKDKSVQQFKAALPTLFPVTVKKEDTSTTARPLGEVDVKVKEDTEDCSITGIAAISGNRLVVTDRTNSALKLVNVNLSKVTFRMAVSSPPYDVISIKQNQVAVAMGKEMKIEIYLATDILIRSQTIHVPGTQFSSICYDGKTFIALDNIARAVKKVNMAGKVVHTVYTDTDSNPLFVQPRYITLGRNRDVVYITDWKADTLTCMTMRGVVSWVYKHADFKCPLCVALGRGGNVMVCSRDDHAVLLLSSSGQLVQVLLDEKRGLAPSLRAICVSDDKLLVSSNSAKPENKNYLRVFQLE